MKLRLLDITEQEKRLESSEDASHYPALAAAIADGDCVFLAPVTARLAVLKEYDHIRVAGQVGSTVRLQCARCLVDIDREVVSRFTIFYTKATGTSQDEEVELTEEDLVAATYSGDEIDFAEEVAEQLLLELPYKPLCDENCKGLCPSCGTDLNRSSCSCVTATSLSFSPLQGFKVKS